MRLIDADKLKKHYAWWESTELGKQNKQLFDDIVDLQPTVESREPIKPTPSLPNWYWCECGRAIKRRIGKSKIDIQYCPFCGQRLEWEEGEESESKNENTNHRF